MTDNTVVPKTSAADEEQFHAALMESVGRMIGKFGKAKVAQVMGVSVRQLDNLGGGSFPRPDRLFNLRALDFDALDPIDRLYGARGVPRDAICSTDPVSTKLARLLTRTIDMECPGSDGGQEVSLAELLTLGSDEDTLRFAASKLHGFVERIDAYRAGETPKLRSVG